MSGSISRIFYADDSGDLDKGWIVYGWLELKTEHWDEVLKAWLTFRKKLASSHSIPVSSELHTVKLVGGRGALLDGLPLSLKPHTNNEKIELGRSIILQCLEAISNLSHIEVGLAYMHTQARNKDLAPVREAAYTKLVNTWDGQLLHANEYGLVGMDGDASDPIYRAAHRSLDLEKRRVIEDPMFLDSKHSQWTQIADIIAWAGYRYVNSETNSEFAVSWYRDYLEPLNPAGPLNLA